MSDNRNMPPEPTDGSDRPEDSASQTVLEEFGGYDTVHGQLAYLAEQIAHPDHLAAFTAKGVVLLPHGMPSILVGENSGYFHEYAQAYCAQMCFDQDVDAVVGNMYHGAEAVPLAREYFGGVLSVLGSELQPDQLAELQGLLPPEAGQSE